MREEETESSEQCLIWWTPLPQIHREEDNEQSIIFFFFIFIFLKFLIIKNKIWFFIRINYNNGPSTLT